MNRIIDKRCSKGCNVEEGTNQNSVKEKTEEKNPKQRKSGLT